MSTATISFRRRVAGNARHNPLAAIGVLLIVLFVVFALFAPWIAPQDPAAIQLPTRLDPPVCGALVRHRRTRTRHSLSRRLWSAHFHAGG